MSQSKFWCFTLNNPTEDETQNVATFLEGPSCLYGIFGREVGVRGTPHLQGYVILARSQRLSYLRNSLSARAHFEKARGSPEDNYDYCTKGGDFDEFGTLPRTGQGRRSDLDRYVEWIDKFTEDNGRPPASPDFAKHQPNAYVKYGQRLVRTAALRAPPRQLEFGEPNEWQRGLAQKCSQPADARSVDFVIDTEGGKGKTWFCRWMLTSRPEDVQVLGVGKKDDLAYMLDETKTIFLFNVARSQMEYMSLPLLENLKDRMVVSTKYCSKLKTWDRNVHVIVLGNEYPKDTMTEDRYNYIDIS